MKHYEIICKRGKDRQAIDGLFANQTQAINAAKSFWYKERWDAIEIWQAGKAREMLCELIPR